MRKIQVLHATPCLVNTLKNIRALLQPQGFLFLQELSPRKSLDKLRKFRKLTAS